MRRRLPITNKGTREITLRSSTGALKRSITIVEWSDSKFRATHNPGAKFLYEWGRDEYGAYYETKAHGGGWRQFYPEAVDHQPDAVAAGGAM